MPTPYLQKLLKNINNNIPSKITERLSRKLDKTINETDADDILSFIKGPGEEGKRPAKPAKPQKQELPPGAVMKLSDKIARKVVINGQMYGLTVRAEGAGSGASVGTSSSRTLLGPNGVAGFLFDPKEYKGRYNYSQSVVDQEVDETIRAQLPNLESDLPEERADAIEMIKDRGSKALPVLDDLYIEYTQQLDHARQARTAAANDPEKLEVINASIEKLDRNVEIVEALKEELSNLDNMMEDMKEQIRNTNPTLLNPIGQLQAEYRQQKAAMTADPKTAAHENSLNSSTVIKMLQIGLRANMNMAELLGRLSKYVNDLDTKVPIAELEVDVLDNTGASQGKINAIPIVFDFGWEVNLSGGQRKATERVTYGRGITVTFEKKKSRFKSDFGQGKFKKFFPYGLYGSIENEQDLENAKDKAKIHATKLARAAGWDIISIKEETKDEPTEVGHEIDPSKKPVKYKIDPISKQKVPEADIEILKAMRKEKEKAVEKGQSPTEVDKGIIDIADLL